MQKDPFLTLPPSERTIFFVKATEGTTLPPLAIEKDWWVTKVLLAIRTLDYRDSIQFKGGTSLSKGWGLISRFSEDVDELFERLAKISPELFRTITVAGGILTAFEKSLNDGRAKN